MSPIMKIFVCVAPFLLALLVYSTIFARQTGRSNSCGMSSQTSNKTTLSPTEANGMNTRGRRGRPIQTAGSRLPDCSHACGSCKPCLLAVVSLSCASESETCPVSYRCFCNNKSYPVP